MHDLKTGLDIVYEMFKRKYSNTSISDKLKAKKRIYLTAYMIFKKASIMESLKIFLTIPTNTASCERTFSCLKRLKIYFIMIMKQERLNSFAILQFMKIFKINSEQVIAEFDATCFEKERQISLKLNKHQSF